MKNFLNRINFSNKKKIEIEPGETELDYIPLNEMEIELQKRKQIAKMESRITHPIVKTNVNGIRQNRN